MGYNNIHDYKSKDKKSKLIVDIYIYLICNSTVIILFTIKNSNNKSKIF